MASLVATDIPAIVEVALDKLSVRLIPRPDRSAKALDAPSIIAHLQAMGIVLDPRGEAEVADFCRPRKAGQVVFPCIVAMGVAPVDDVPAQLQLLATASSLPGSTSRRVRAGEAVAVLVARKVGKDGVDVMGKAIPRRQADQAPVIDASLAVAADGKTYVATIDGVVRVRGTGANRTIAVYPCLHHSSDITGKVVHSTGDIQIDGVCSGSSLRGGGDVQIKADFDNSVAMCEGDFSAGVVRSAKIDADGNCAAAEIMHSRIHAGGEVNVPSGAIVGGTVTAAAGVRCRVLGGADFTKTLIEVGSDQRLSQKLATLIPEIEARQSKVARIRLAVEPLLQSNQVLTPQQQLKIGALLAEADALDTLVIAQRRELREECEAAMARCKNEVHISDIVHPGVTIRFPGAQTTVRIALRGPCKICLEPRDGQPCVVLIREGTAGMPLELCKLAEDWRINAKRIAA
jgi:uncharacterized protein (DUF342 family)